jgi:N6-adenosine-specific RNA methylase IME4
VADGVRAGEDALSIEKSANGQFGLKLPGQITRTFWELPDDLSEGDWINCGECLGKIETAVQWWLGDWWKFGENRQWGAGEEIADRIGVNYNTVIQYGVVAREFQFSERSPKLKWSHYLIVMAAVGHQIRLEWLERALNEGWSVNELKTKIARQAAIDKTIQTDFDAAKLGKFVVLYADPPWRYEWPPMGGSNRSIENHYPTLTLEEICALPVGDIAHENSILFLWATSPKLPECLRVVEAWGFTHRTGMAWVKDKIGMGFHVRERHEILLIAKRGELPPPPPEARPDSVVEAPRLEHSAKPPVFYDLIDRMYPDIRKIELFGRVPEQRELWTAWGNQVERSGDADRASE